MADERWLLSTEQFGKLLTLLKKDSYRLMGPQVRDKVIVYDEIASAQDLPIGWKDEQEPGSYRLKKRDDNAYFGYNLGPHSWKQFLFPPRERLFSAEKKEGDVSISLEVDPPIQKMAFIGVHPCELQAMIVQDKVFEHPIATYEQYKARREQLFILAVNCTQCVHTCFCASMGTGPAVQERYAYDLAFTEVIDEQGHYFVVDSGSERGRGYCKLLDARPASREESERATALVDKNKEQMARHVDNEHVHEMLMNSWPCKRWDQVAERCINCTNCTMVCPTCFCSEYVENASIDGTCTERCQRWDSCFTLSHSYVHGWCVRPSAKSRYRQWLTHKFGTWWDQFGLSGCVGCGRCITWCPVGIDVTEELDALQKEVNQADT